MSCLSFINLVSFIPLSKCSIVFLGLKNTRRQILKIYHRTALYFKRVVKGFYVMHDCPKISRVMRDCAQLIRVIRDKIVQCDAWFAILEGRDA